MTIRFFASVNAFASTNPSTSAGLVSSPSAGPLILVRQDMIKFFILGNQSQALKTLQP